LGQVLQTFTTFPPREWDLKVGFEKFMMLG